MNTIQKIKRNPKKTKVRIYLNEQIDEIKQDMYRYVVIGEWKRLKEVLDRNHVKDYMVETLCVNSAMDLLDTKDLHARIEYGAIIRDDVLIGHEAVILMGAVINTGCVIGERTMVDMGAVLGGHVIVKENCHIGANAVLAGVIEPYHEKNIVIEKNTFIGAGAIILEGVHIGENVVVGANAVVKEDLPNDCVAVGVPAKIIQIQENHSSFMIGDLRKL